MERKRFTIELPWPSVNKTKLSKLLPTSGNVIFTLLMIVLLVAAQSVGALPLGRPQAAPTSSTSTIAYQGRLANASGEPLTDTVPMIFRLYDVATGGAPLWEEQWTGPNSVRVSDGLFNVMLGSLAAIPQSVVTGNSSLWLGITVGTDDEMTPRVQLGSVPFAVQALTVPDGSVTTAKIADGAVTQGKLSLNNGLEMSGDLQVSGNLMLVPGSKRILFSDPGNYDFSIVHNGGSSLDFRLPEYPGGEVTALRIQNGGGVSVRQIDSSIGNEGGGLIMTAGNGWIGQIYVVDSGWPCSQGGGVTVASDDGVSLCFRRK